jgi:succinyl-diaminopimelate desuccinylase
MNKFEKILKQIKKNRAESIDLLKKLVKIRTVVPPGENYEKIANLIGNTMENYGCDVTFFETPEKYMKMSGAELFEPPLEGSRINVIGEYGSNKGKTLLFNGHYDIVPVGPGWTNDPFSGIVKDGVLFGRGASDNKGGIVAMMMAAKALSDLGYTPKGNMVLTATPDEEVGGISGLGAVLEEGLVKADYGISCDGGQDNIGISNQGRFKGKIITEGFAVHSSRAQHGINAIEKMSKIVLAIQEHGRELRSRSTSIPAPPSTGREFVYPTTNVGVIHGGLKENIVPDYCVIFFNRRVTPEETLEGARKEFLSVIENAVSGDSEIKWRFVELNTREPSYTSPDHPYVTDFKKMAEEVLDREIPVYGGLGGNDVCYMRNILKIPAVQFGASRKGSNSHGIDENIKIDYVLDASKVYASAVLKWLGVE